MESPQPKKSETRNNTCWYNVAIHPQYAQHDDLVIVADVEGLLALRAVIDTCLNTGESATGATFDPGDGEGYIIHVLLLSKPEIEAYVGANYVADYARANSKSILEVVYKKKLHPVLDEEKIKKQFVPITEKNKDQQRPKKPRRRRSHKRKKYTTVNTTTAVVSG